MSFPHLIQANRQRILGPSQSSLAWLTIGFLLLGLAQAGTAQTVNYNYDKVGRLTHVQYSNGSKVDYIYDALGNRLVQAMTVSGSPSNQPPSVVTFPNIANAATNVILTPALNWNAATDTNPGDVVVYYIYFGTTPSPPLAYSGWSTNWSPSQLKGLTTYYWYVVARDSHNAQSTSPTWSFTTTYVPPVANFTASATNGSAPATISFYDGSTCIEDIIVAWAWDFNADGIVDSTLRNPTFTFSSGGNYSVKLTAQGAIGGTGTVTKTNFISLLGSNIVDLASSALGIESAAQARTLRVQYTVSNLGTTNVNLPWSYSDVFFVSTNSVLDASAVQVATFYENQPLPAGGNYNRTNLVIIPSGYGQNSYLFLKSDGNNQIGEVNETNNIRLMALAGVLPDLTPNNFNLAGTTLAGQPIQVTYSGTNQGSIEINAQWNDAVFLSTNAALNSAAIRLGTFYIANQTVAPGGKYSITNTVTLPQVTPGNYFLLLNLDDGDGLVETNEANNIAAIPVSMTAPDLSPVSFNAPGTIFPGQSVSVSCVVTNQGSGAGVGYWYDAIYLSTNATLNGNDLPIAYVYQNHNVAVSGSYGWTNAVTIPQVTGGTYRLFVVANDPRYWIQVAEGSRANNTNSVLVTVQVADLSPASITAPASVSPGQSVAVTCVVTNKGNGNGIGNWYDMIYLSTNATLGTGAQLLAALFQNRNVSAGGNYSWTNNITIPQVTGGSYYLFVVANDSSYGNTLTEATRANNTNSVATTVLLSDLSPSISGVPPVVSPGQSVSVVCVVTNQGSGAGIGGWYDAIYLTTNTSLSVTDQPLSYVYQVHNVAAAGVYAWTNVFNIPQVIGGTYRMFVVANDPRYGGQIVETSKANNTNSVVVAVQVADIAPTTITAPSAVSPGQSVSVTCVVTNKGNGSGIGYWNDTIYLSTNAATIAGGQLLASVYQNHNVTAGGSYAWTNAITIPQVKGGDYYLFVVADDSYYYGGQLSESIESNNTNSVAVTIQVPDLSPAISGVPVAVSAGQSVSLICTMTNLGNGSGIGGWYDSIYLSTNAVLSAGGQYLAAVYQNHNVTAGGSYRWTNTTTIPQVTGGTYYLFVVANDPYYGNQITEASKANNTNSVAVTIQVPDLVPAISGVPAIVSAGQSISVICSMTNQGNGAGIGGWYDTIYIGTNAASTGGGQILASVYQNHNVAAGGTYGWTNSVTVPQVTGGTYYIFVVANDPYYGNQITEASKLNNTNSVALTIQVPDLKPGISGVPAVVSAGQSMSVICIMTNLGNGTGNGVWYDSIYLSTNAVLSAGGQYLGTVYQNHSVAAGGTYGWTNSVTVPQVTGGTYYLFVVANDPYYGNQIAEASKLNNTNSVALTIQVPDLTPGISGVQAIVSAGQSMSVICTMTNQGNGAGIGGWYDTIYIGTNASSTAGGQLLASVYQNHNVAAGGTYGWTNSVTVPQVTGGTYYIFVVANDPYYGNQIAEATKLNNTNSVALTIQVADLALSISGVPSIVSAGQSVPVICAVTNQGNGSALGYWYDSIYLSTNAALNAGGQLLDTVYLNHNIPAGGSYRWTNATTIPQVAAGAYYIFVVANDPYYGSQITESSKANNTNSVPLTIQVADLYPRSISVPANVSIGPGVPVVCVVTNQGIGGGIGYWYDGIYLSTNTVLSTNDQPIASVYLNHNVAAGGSYAWTNLVTIPQKTGPQNLFVVVNDPRNGLQIAESSKSNNTDSASLTVHPSDLSPLNVIPATNSVVFHPPFAQNPTVSVRWAVTNRGSGAAYGGWYDRVYVSTNAAISGAIISQTFTESWTSPTLAVGGTYSRTNLITLPKQSGTYYLVFSADDFAYNYIFEGNETNNLLVSGPVTLEYELYPPDLTPLELTASVLGVAGQPTKVSWAVTNQGNGVASGGWYDRVYVSTNAAISGAVSSQFFTENWTSPTLAIGGAYFRTNLITLPTQSGNYYLVLSSDDYAYNYIYEANESNNVMATPISVVPNSPGLAISVIASPNPVFALSNLSYTIAVINRGPLAASGVVVSDTIQGSISIVSSVSSQGAVSLSGGIFTWNLGSLTNGASAIETLIVRPDIEGIITNSAIVSATSASASTNTAASTITTVVQNPSGPVLQITRVGNNVVLCWSTNANGYYLQSKTSLSSATAWSSVANASVKVGDRFYVTNTIAEFAKFYRLSNQTIPPSLMANFYGGSIVISWTTNSSGFSLQSTTNLLPTTTWVTVSNNPIVTGVNYSVTNTAIGNRRFYRLVK